MAGRTRLGRHVVKWMLLVTACALPLLVLMWNKAEPGLLVAELLGVAIWVAVMAGLDARLLKRGRQRASRALALGALTFSVIETMASLISVSLMMYVYAPFFLMLMAGRVVDLPQSRFAVTLIFTIACGLSALLVVLLLAAMFLRFGRLPAIDVTQSRINRRGSIATTPGGLIMVINDTMVRNGKTLRGLLALYGLASLVHFVHNAEHLVDYPNLPVWLSRFQIYGAWCGITALGIVGYTLPVEAACSSVSRSSLSMRHLDSTGFSTIDARHSGLTHWQ